MLLDLGVMVSLRNWLVVTLLDIVDENDGWLLIHIIRRMIRDRLVMHVIEHDLILFASHLRPHSVGQSLVLILSHRLLWRLVAII